MSWTQVLGLILRNAGLLGGFAVVYGLMTHYPGWKAQLGLEVSNPVLFIGLLAWGFCVGSSYEAARSKKRSAAEWVVLAVFFGPLALLALAALGPEGTACPSCDTVYRKHAPRCPVCSYPAPHQRHDILIPPRRPREQRVAERLRG